MKKKLLFTAYNLGLGGIETALVNLLKSLDYDKYEVTLILEKKEGIFLNQIPKEVEVLEYSISDSSVVLLRKLVNGTKLIKWKNKLNNKYDFSCCYATYSIPGAHLALAASKNSCLWVHSNYYLMYDKNILEMAKFFDSVMTKDFSKILFVSNEALNNVTDHYEGIKDKSIVCGNIIDGETIINKSNDNCDYNRREVTTFVNVGRHDESTKRLSRIINSSARLKNEGLDFDVVFVGEGKDTDYYKELVDKNILNDYIHFVGKKENPYPYYKMADAVLMSSENEGYPVVFLESMILNKPILSTKVSDYENLNNKYGIFVDKSEDEVYKLMKDFINNGFEIKEKFDYKKYNKDILDKLDNFITE